MSMLTWVLNFYMIETLQFNICSQHEVIHHALHKKTLPSLYCKARSVSGLLLYLFNNKIYIVLPNITAIFAAPIQVDNVPDFSASAILFPFENCNITAIANNKATSTSTTITIFDFVLNITILSSFILTIYFYYNLYVNHSIKFQSYCSL